MSCVEDRPVLGVFDFFPTKPTKRNQTVTNFLRFSVRRLPVSVHQFSFAFAPKELNDSSEGLVGVLTL